MERNGQIFFFFFSPPFLFKVTYFIALALLIPPKRSVPEAFETTFERAQWFSLLGCPFALRYRSAEAVCNAPILDTTKRSLNREKKITPCYQSILTLIGPLCGRITCRHINVGEV